MNGTRTFYVRKGLSGLDLDGDLGLYSNWVNLAGSNPDGRVVLVSNGEAVGAQKLKDRKGEL